MKARTLSAAILLPIVITVLVIGHWPFALFLALATGLACGEYVAMLRRSGYTLALPLTLAINWLWLADAYQPLDAWLPHGMAAISLLTAAWALYRRQRHPDDGNFTAQWALTLAGGLYIGLGGAYIYQLRAMPEGLWWMLTALPIVWVSESAAYFVGRRYGRHKIAPHISPGKSWEGYAGEVIAGIVTGLLLGGFMPRFAGVTLSVNMWKGGILGLVIATITTAGDFFISMIKREVGIKDTGALIPGHGGVLDRIDSLLWTGILAFAIAQWLWYL